MIKGILKFVSIASLIVAIAGTSTFGYIQTNKLKNSQKANQELMTENEALKKANSFLKDEAYELEQELNKKTSEATEEKAKEKEVNKVVTSPDNSNKDDAYIPGLPVGGTYMPSLIGLPLDYVEEILYQANLQFGTILYEFSDYAEGTVIYQHCKANTVIAVNSKVHMTVSKGPKKDKNTDIPKEETEKPMAEETNNK